MGDRLGTPGVVDFMFFFVLRFPPTLNTTRKSLAKLKTSHCSSRKSQIKKSKLILVTAFKVGFHFFFSGFRISILGGREFKLQMKVCHCKNTLHCRISRNSTQSTLSYVKSDQHLLVGSTGCLRPYHDEYTRSRPITEVKHRRARIVLGWGTAWEHLVS